LRGPTSKERKGKGAAGRGKSIQRREGGGRTRRGEGGKRNGEGEGREKGSRGGVQ